MSSIVDDHNDIINGWSQEISYDNNDIITSSSPDISYDIDHVITDLSQENLLWYGIHDIDDMTLETLGCDTDYRDTAKSNYGRMVIMRYVIDGF